MKEGKMTEERRAKEKTTYSAADKDKDSSLSFEEFFSSRTRKTVPREKVEKAKEEK